VPKHERGERERERERERGKIDAWTKRIPN